MDDWKTSLILSDLQAACNALGGWEDDKYVKEADCIESLRDLLKYIRRDDESFAVRRALGKINVVRTDLIPLVRFYRDDADVFDITTKLLVNLTTPVILLYKEELPVEKNARNIYMTLEAANCTYKDAFLEKEIWTVFGERLEQLMNLNYHERSDEDKEIMERILILMRNVLHPIHKEELSLKTDGDVSSHDRLIWAFHLAGIDDLIIYLCGSRMEQSYTLHVLEILRLMLREQEPEFLASAGELRSHQEVQKEVDELVKLREIEQRKKTVAMKAVIQNRFARFSSTYQVKNVKGLDDDSKDIIVVGDQSKVLQSLNNMDFDKKKKFRARAKNRRPEESTSIKRRTTLNIRLFLKEFCSEFLNSAFNSLLPQARRAIARAGDTGDEGQYFWLLDFFLAFNRLTGFDISLVSEAISRETFHFVQGQMEKCHEMMVTDKRRIHLWMKRLHINLKTFKQLITIVAAMSQHTDGQVREASKILQRHLFHLPEYRDIALHLLLNFNENVAPVAYLRDLAMTVHIYLKMLEKAAKARAAPKPIKPKIPDVLGMTEEELDQRWLEVSRELTAFLDVGESEIDFDINLVLEGFHQYEESFHIKVCKQKIADFLRKSATSSAIGLLRACRRHFPSDETFGQIVMPVEAEFLLLKKFFYGEYLQTELDDRDLDDEGRGMENFEFDDFVKRFVNPKIVKAYALLLANYNTNSHEVNKVCLKMLHRIAFDMKMSAMLFQAQLFVTFDKILDDYELTPDDPNLKELARFANFIIHQFVEVTKINDIAMVELLFWKTSAEAYQILYGYNESEKSKTRPWTEEEEAEIKALYEEHHDKMQPGQDVIEVIQKEFSNQTRSRRQIINQLRNMGIVEKGQRFKAGSAGISSRQPWSLEEEQELQELYQKFATSVDPLTQIMLNQTVKRPKFRVIEKLLELGCIHDRSEVRKRRARKNGEVARSSRTSKSNRDNDPSCISKEFLSTTDDSSSDDDVRRHEEIAEQLEGHHETSVDVRKNQRIQKKRRKPNKPKQKKTNRIIEKIVNSEELQNLLKLTVQHRRPALDWITESMQDALEDWKDADNEAVPLVPLLGPEHDSLADNDFCRLLSTFGFVPPQDGVEQYWRIAGTLTKRMLQSRLNAIKKAVDGEFDEGIVVNDEAAGTREQSSDDEASDEEQPTREKRTPKEKKAAMRLENFTANSESDEENEESEKEKQSNEENEESDKERESDEENEESDKERQLDEERDGQTDSINGEISETANLENSTHQGSKRSLSVSPIKPSKKRKVLLDSDSDDDRMSEDERITRSDEENENSQQDKDNVANESELPVEGNGEKKRRKFVIESDEE